MTPMILVRPGKEQGRHSCTRGDKLEMRKIEFCACGVPFTISAELYRTMAHLSSV